MKYSYIIPVYNGEQYIDRCFESLLSQTYDNYEIIIINDGSTDGSLSKLKGYAKKYKQIKIFNTKNNGVSSARNLGIDKAKGNYLIFVDIDDYVDINMLASLESSIANNGQSDIIKYNYICINNFDEIKKVSNDVTKSITLRGADAFADLVNKKIPFDLNCIYAFKRSYLKKHHFKFETGKEHEDFGLIPYVVIKASKVTLLDKSLYFYIQSPNSITRNSSDGKQLKQFKDLLYHFDNLLKKITNDTTTNTSDKKVFCSYIANAVIFKYQKLNKENKGLVKYELKKRRIVDFLMSDTFLRKIKRTIYKTML